MSRFERQRLRDQVVDALIELIEERGLKDGDLFPSERTLVAEFGVSRTVIREALSTLEVRGLLAIDQGKRPRVVVGQGTALRDELRMMARVDPISLWELYEVRSILEVEVAGLAAIRHDEAALADMRSALTRMKAHLEEPEGYIEADVAFHEAVLSGTGNRVLQLMMQPVTELMLTSRRATASQRRKPQLALDEHVEILEAIERRDRDAAAEAMRLHLDATREDLRVALGEDSPLE